ncbi:Aste57867_16201 [Aphanomyces stellatus]|uniref:Aste57867_16201 protein n=1 Tax=Aphanomyces stellatus TaxID=120398 RepID=A0A485L684_9STRA|nr:hypothetical protein As57867_016145 [Aphanomyces stellatus]VFT92979.1 Aste57867_16201 [Aphanomyces stellatus]
MHIGDERPGCSIAYFLLVCAPIMAVKMSWSAQWAALNPVLNNVLSHTAWKVQAVQLIGPITGIIVAPAVGVHSDRSTSKYGQRRPYIFLSAISTIICWCIMAYLKEWFRGKNDTLFMGLTIFCYVWMDVTCNVLQTVTYLLISDVAGPRQVTGSAIAQFYGVFGQMVVSIYISLNGNPSGSGVNNDNDSLQPFFALLIAVMTLTVMPVCYFVRENPWEAMRRIAPGSAFEAVYLPRTSSIWTAWYVGIKTLPSALFVYWAATLCSEAGFHSYNGVKTTYFGVDVYNGKANCNSTEFPNVNCTRASENYAYGVDLATGACDQFYNAIAMLFLVFLPVLVQRFGVRNVFCYGFFLQCFLLAFVFFHDKVLSVIIVGLMAIPQAAVFALQVPVILNVVGVSDEKVLGLYLGAFNTAGCLGQMITFASSSLFGVLVESSWPTMLVGGVFSILAFGIMVAKFHVKMQSW